MYIINNQTYTGIEARIFFDHVLAGCETILMDCLRVDFVEYVIEVKEDYILIYLDNLCEITVTPNKNISFVFVGCGTIEINTPHLIK